MQILSNNLSDQSINKNQHKFKKNRKIKEENTNLLYFLTSFTGAFFWSDFSTSLQQTPLTEIHARCLFTNKKNSKNVIV